MIYMSSIHALVRKLFVNNKFNKPTQATFSLNGSSTGRRVKLGQRLVKRVKPLNTLNPLSVLDT
jgi:hypothetical protein